MSARTFAMRTSDTPLYGTRNVLTAFDLAPNRPDVAMELIRKFSHQFKHTAGLDFMLMGREIGISSESHHAYTEGRFWNTMTADAQVVQTGAGNPQVINVTLDNGAFFPKVGHVILYPGNARVQALVTAVTAADPAVVTVVPFGNTNLPQIDAGDELVILTSAWGEGTAQPDPSAPTYDRLDYFLQIFKEKYAITGSQLTNKLEFSVDEDGTTIGVYNTGLADTEARLLRMQEMAFLLGNGDANVHAALNAAGLTTATSNFVQTTKGLVQWIAEQGGTDNTIDATNWTVADLDDIDDHMKGEGDTSPIVIGYVGGVLGRRISGQIAALNKQQASWDS